MGAAKQFARSFTRLTVMRDGDVIAEPGLLFTAEHGREAGHQIVEAGEELPLPVAVRLVHRWNRRQVRGIGFPRHFYSLEL